MQKRGTNILKKNSDKILSNILKPYEQLNEKQIDGNTLKAKIIDSPIGSFVAVSNDESLLMLTFADSKNLDSTVKRIIKSHSKKLIENDDVKPLKSIESELKAYFKGDLIDFETPIHIDPNESEFQRAIWNGIHEIRYGETCTYAELANSISKPNSFRAAANACGRNPICIVIPCHRVLKTGGIGGFGCGVERKIWLLDHEKNTLKLREAEK